MTLNDILNEQRIYAMLNDVRSARIGGTSV